MVNTEFISFLSAVQRMSASIPKEELVDDKQVELEKFKNCDNDYLLNLFERGCAAYGDSKDKLISFINTLRSKHNICDNVFNVLLHKYDSLGFTDWYMCMKPLSTGDMSFVLCTGMDSNGTRIEFNNIDIDYGIFGYVYNFDCPEFSEAGSVPFVWVGDAYMPRLYCSY